MTQAATTNEKAVDVAGPVTVDVTAPTEPVASAAPAVVAPVLPEGQAVDVDPTAAAPGEIVQLIHQFPAGTILRGLVLGTGLKVTTVLVGRMRFPGPDGAKWDDCYGKTVPDGAFVILLAENTADETVIARATWYVVTAGAAAPVKAAASNAAGPGVAMGTTAVVTAPYPQAFAQAPIPSGPQAVTPGTNEVAILMQRQECERLLRFFNGGEVVPHQDHPGIVRQLLAALSR